ncbi:MAG TPA: response regulator [Gaiellaceae bacterium]|nr:response regulator [Gaiellaceae bacterium]
METLATAAPIDPRARGRRLEVLIADDDPGARAMLAARVSEALRDALVLQAKDGAEAVQVGLQRRPQLALLDVQMPRLGGVEAAITLRELRPAMRVALHTADPPAHRERARDHLLPLLDKLDPDAAVRWLEAQVEALAATRPPRNVLAR